MRTTLVSISGFLTAIGGLVLMLVIRGIQEPPQHEPAGALFAAVMFGMILLPLDALFAVTGGILCGNARLGCSGGSGFRQ